MASKRGKRVESAAMAAQDMRERGLVEAQENLEQYNIRLAPSDVVLLRRHFRGLGLNVSAGIRMVISAYMQDKGLR